MRLFKGRDGTWAGSAMGRRLSGAFLSFSSPSSGFRDFMSTLRYRRRSVLGDRNREVSKAFCYEKSWANSERG